MDLANYHRRFSRSDLASLEPNSRLTNCVSSVLNKFTTMYQDGSKFSSIKEVLFSGSSTLLPCVRELAGVLLSPTTRTVTAIPPGDAVIRGAALSAALEYPTQSLPVNARHLVGYSHVADFVYRPIGVRLLQLTRTCPEERQLYSLCAIDACERLPTASLRTTTVDLTEGLRIEVGHSLYPYLLLPIVPSAIRKFVTHPLLRSRTMAGSMPRCTLPC